MNSESEKCGFTIVLVLHFCFLRLGVEHGAQLLRSHSLRHLLAGRPLAEAQHEGEHADLASHW